MKNKLNKDFLEKLENIYTSQELDIIEQWFCTKSRDTTFRLNHLKDDDFDSIKTFENYGYKIEKIDFLKDAYRILEVWKLKITNMKPFTKGYIYVQWITSQIPVSLVNLPKIINSDFKVLDLTASPGWKTTQIASLMRHKWLVVANELNTIRSEKLKSTIDKQEARNVEIIKFDANDLKNHYKENSFDVIIADLPCSAEWRINLENEKSYKFLEKAWLNKRNYKIQQEIIKNNIGLLKVWWQLIYSTCTIDPLENEWIVHYILSNFPELEIVDISDFFTQDWLKEISKAWIKKYKKYIFRKQVEKSFRILPSKLTEWFFVAKFIKKS